MRPSPWMLLAVALLAGCKAGYQNLPVSTPYVDPVRLAFQPPVDAPLVETVTQSQRTGDGDEDRVEVELESRFARNSGGWVLTQRVLQSRYTHAGQPAEHPLGNVLTRFALRLQLAEDGSFVRVIDAEAPGRAVEDAGVSDPKLRAALLTYFSPDAVHARAEREWASTYGNLFSRNLRDGQRLYALESVSSAAGEQSFMVERQVAGKRKTAAGDALVLALRCPSAPPSPLPGDWTRAQGVAILTEGVRCDGELVLSEATSLPLSRALSAKGTGPSPWTFERRTTLRLTPEEKTE